jgi:hypothetical protein
MEARLMDVRSERCRRPGTPPGGGVRPIGQIVAELLARLDLQPVETAGPAEPPALVQSSYAEVLAGR